MTKHKHFTIIDAIQHKQVFGRLPAFASLDSWQSWLVWLKAIHALPMTDIELEIFRECTSRQSPPMKPPAECYTIVGRRGGKSFMTALTAVYLGCFGDYKRHLNAGERASILVLAVDRAQTRVVFGYIKGIIDSIPALRQMVVAERADELELDNSVVIATKTSDYRGIRGLSIACVIADEVSFWPDQGVNPDTEIFRALKPAMLTIPDSKLLCISTPYARSGVLFDAHRSYFAQDNDRALVWVAPSTVMNPSLDQEQIDRDIAADPSAARSEWLAEFRDDLEAAFSLEALEACVVRGRDELPAAPTVAYSGFVDPSGGRQDSFAIAVAHQEEGVSVLDVIREWKPKFDPSTVVSEAAAIFKQYGVINIVGDNYGGEWPVEAFRNCGISYQRSTKHRSELYLEFIPKISGKQVELLDNRELIEELRRLERRRGRTGKDSIDHRVGAHDDAANAVAGVMSLLDAKTQSSNVFNPSLHISRQPLRFAPSGWPLIVGISADETFAASVIAQTYMSEVRVFAAWCSEGISLRHHLEEFPKAWLAANSPRLQLFGGYADDPNPEIRGKLHDAAVEVLNGQWCSVWHKYDTRLDKMRDALQKAVPFKFTPAVTFSPVDTAALTQALSSGRYRDKVAADKRSYHCVNALSLLLCRLEFWKNRPKEGKPRPLPPSWMAM